MFGTIGKSKVVHSLVDAGQPATACGKVVTTFVDDDAAEAAKKCSTCEAIERSIDNTPEGDSMATKSDDTTTPATVTLDEEIRANIERVRSLSEAENFASADELAKETETLISSIKGAGSIAIRKEWRAQLSEAGKAKTAEVAKVHEGTVVLETQDPYSVEGARELVSKGAADLTEGVRLQLKTTDMAHRTAETLFAVRLKMSDKNGAPDLGARGAGSRKAAADLYGTVGQSLEDTFANRQAVKKLMRSVQYQMSDVVVKYVRSLDTNPEEFAKYGVAKEAHPEASPSDAVFAYYGLTKESQSEVGARREAEKRALAAGARQAIESGSAAEGDEDEDEGGEGGETEATQVDPDEYTKAVAGRFAKAGKGVNVEVIGHASDEAKKAARTALEAQLEILKNLITATL